MSIVKQSSSIRNFSASGVSQNSDAFTPADMALTVFHRFEQQANLFPDRLALGDGGSHVTYAELNAAANRLARAIVDRRGATVEPVALLLEHGPAHPLAIMAVLKLDFIQVARSEQAR